MEVRFEPHDELRGAAMAVLSISFTLLIFFRRTYTSHCSIFSRFRNPHEYVAPTDAWLPPEELSPDMYHNLLLEVPELATMRSPNGKSGIRLPPSRMPYLRKSTAGDDGDNDLGNEEDPDGYENKDEEEETTRHTTEKYRVPNTTTKTRTAPDYKSTSKIMPFLTKSRRKNLSWTHRKPKSGRRWWFGWGWYGTKVATCYFCGMETTGIPVSPLCHNAFDSNDWQYRTMQRYLRAKCFYNTNYWDHRYESATFAGKSYYNDYGLMRGYYGLYIGGCVKRFLDIGEVYTQRSCRTLWPRTPTNAKNFATHRYARLEIMLKKEKDACIMSPHASLTPFARSISLFARYYVCVCNTKYCNGSVTSGVSIYLLLLGLFNIRLIYYSCFFIYCKYTK